jgi:hypothetical protein
MKKPDLQDVIEKAAMWLYRGNRAAERGESDLAERHFARSQRWHDLMIDLQGEGDSTATAKETP